jgi:hypothetical protein
MQQKAVLVKLMACRALVQSFDLPLSERSDKLKAMRWLGIWMWMIASLSRPVNSETRKPV